MKFLIALFAFGAAVIGAQWVIPDNEQAYKV